MKSLMIVAALAGAFVTTSAFAQTTQPAASQTQTQTAAATQVAATSTAPVAQAGGWVAPYGEPVHQKTRAEVYHELVQAEQDGQLAYLNSTLYAH
ncbi:MAG: DUF4148 domain-containing protein [Paraburkholderia tropica]|uniref:Uncharacterized protein DUF4148 n=1 Tax=Paraburkholderia tropica TaxID=92647 RepID=A0ABX5MHY6_9BURK|nr:DUF4148 domain-containing protein [Paraburkholderia tropica]MBB3004875.1 hypothetical protein [Paraburkholderia tropica]MBB6323897.1 hypothetical protein [Paraburkholderia tropica]MDE1140363.1 DUF4148 domain-containing protein [Paraburkholderia tropica]PXX05907.1 uncharacterized protein DUF4148 [Paraburkholderia tropica]PZW71764.1 uncharacterized protein DUF4148 [Paraburkholderia tropica]